MNPRITIGMATYNDFSGVYSTIQSVFLHNEWEKPTDVEIVVVDTSPVGSDSRKLVRDFLAKGGHTSPGGRTPYLKYVDMAGTISTTLPRERVVQEASAPIVVVMDCHVMLRSNTLLKLLDWYDDNPEFSGLVQGPILYDNLHTINTHFDDQFRGGMWGTWGNAWFSNGRYFTVHDEAVGDEDASRDKGNGTCKFYDLALNPISPQELGLPEGLGYSQHEGVLLNYGCIEVGREGTIPFDIPGQGLGLFSCRKKDWVGFNLNCSGFGGEEMNIHEKFRQAKLPTVCLPFLHWNHRFGREGGTPYPIPTMAKVRNYVLWANELGLPTERIYNHFVKGNMITEAQWAILMNDPKGYQVEFKQVKKHDVNVDSLFAEVAETDPDLKGYAEIVQSICSSVSSVTAFVKRASWEPAIVSGFPNTINVYQSQDSPLTQRTHDAVKNQDAKDSRAIRVYNTHRGKVDPLEFETIAPVDLLIIDKMNSAEYVGAVLARHGLSAKIIAVRGSQSFGEKAEYDPDKPGIWYALKEFLTNNPDWFIVNHWGHNYGMTVLSNQPHLHPGTEVRPWPKGYGPGTELKAILGSVGINPSPNCDCNARMREMDEWGVEGCRERFDDLVKMLHDKAESWGWYKVVTDKAKDELSLTEKLKIGWKSITTGLAFQVNWLDPYPDLINEAIRRAAIKEQQK